MTYKDYTSANARYKANVRYSFGFSDPRGFWGASEVRSETAWEKEERECKEFFNAILANRKKHGR